MTTAARAARLLTLLLAACGGSDKALVSSDAAVLLDDAGRPVIVRPTPGEMDGSLPGDGGAPLDADRPDTFGQRDSMGQASYDVQPNACNPLFPDTWSFNPFFPISDPDRGTAKVGVPERLAYRTQNIGGKPAPRLDMREHKIAAPFYLIKDGCTDRVLQPCEICEFVVELRATMTGRFFAEINRQYYTPDGRLAGKVDVGFQREVVP